jgi:hypothetical protein
MLKGNTQPTGNITKITVYNSILTHFGNAINRGVMVFLMINKPQADGEVAADGSSFTAGDAYLTAFLIQQMGGITWRCQNPSGELHCKSGYFYSQNTLITDTTNWSNAGMGYQGKSGPNCSSVNNETCLVIKGNALKDDNVKKIFKTRVLANIINTARMYAYQQTCPVADSTFGGFSVTVSPNVNCKCPQANVSCGDPIAKDPKTKKLKLVGTCSMATGEEQPSSCYMELGRAPCDADNDCKGGYCHNKKCVTNPCGGVGACITACCLRYGQTPTTVYWDDICKKIFKLPNWPKITTNFEPQPLGSVYIDKKSGKSYIIDPTFDWSKGVRTSDADLLGYLNGKSLSPGEVKAVTVKSGPYVPPQGNFCTRVGPCSKPSKSKEAFIYARPGVY